MSEPVGIQSLIYKLIISLDIVHYALLLLEGSSLCRQCGRSAGFGTEPMVCFYTLAPVPLSVRSPTVTAPRHLYLCSSMTAIFICLLLSPLRRSLGRDLQCRFWLHWPLLIDRSWKTNCRRHHRSAGYGAAYRHLQNYTPDALLTHTHTPYACVLCL